MDKLNFSGIGPKIGRITIPWLIATIIFGHLKKELFIYSSEHYGIILISGIILIFIGSLFCFSTVRLLLKGLRETRLVKEGVYRFCQNPLYFSFFIMIFPGLSLILNSWLILTSGIIGYILFKIYIGNEYKELERLFGEIYLKYMNETPEFIPLQFRKWFL